MTFKFDQLAVVVQTKVDWVAATAIAPFTVRDIVHARGLNNRREEIMNQAELAFNYDLWPMEYEVLHYQQGWNWHMLRPGPEVRTSHFGTHVKTKAEVETLRAMFLSPALQEVVTVNHTNPACADRRYHYLILDAYRELGCALKVIRRLTLEEADVVLKGLLEQAK